MRMCGYSYYTLQTRLVTKLRPLMDKNSRLTYHVLRMYIVSITSYQSHTGHMHTSSTLVMTSLFHDYFEQLQVRKIAEWYYYLYLNYILYSIVLIVLFWLYLSLIFPTGNQSSGIAYYSTGKTQRHGLELFSIS